MNTSKGGLGLLWKEGMLELRYPPAGLEGNSMSQSACKEAVVAGTAGWLVVVRGWCPPVIQPENRHKELSSAHNFYEAGMAHQHLDFGLVGP